MATIFDLVRERQLRELAAAEKPDDSEYCDRCGFVLLPPRSGSPRCTNCRDGRREPPFRPFAEPGPADSCDIPFGEEPA